MTAFSATNGNLALLAFLLVIGLFGWWALGWWRKPKAVTVSASTPPAPTVVQRRESGGHSSSGMNASKFVVLALLGFAIWFILTQPQGQQLISELTASRHSVPSTSGQRVAEVVPPPTRLLLVPARGTYSDVVEGVPGYAMCVDNASPSQISVSYRDRRFHDMDESHWFPKPEGKVPDMSAERFSSADEQAFTTRVCFRKEASECSTPCPSL
ncbi:MAG: hypothetical protein AAB472_01475 [Patescibacteria group bacterium]